jgi:hypothetical protein
LLFQQVKELGETTVQNSIGIINEETGFVELSTTVQGHHLPHTLNVPIDDPYVMAKGVAAWRAKLKSLKLEFEGQELKDYNEHRNSFFETKVNFPEDQWIVNIIFFSKGWLSFSSNKNISDETFELLKRFAAVFEQTYTRFLDLQKAEAQTRESHIELGLERVRARAMAMQHSDELKELIGTVYSELTKLDLAFDRCLIWIMDSEDLSSRLWMANAESLPVSFYMPHHDNPPYLAFVKAWNDRNTKWQYDLHGQVKKEWDGYVFNQTEMKHLPDLVKKNMQATDRVIFGASFHNFGCLQTAGAELLKGEQFDILNRFAKVFDLTYTRFNDLKQAEAQARESQIQLALERVRARTMAMQKSEELMETAVVLFDQLKQLGEHIERTIIG